MSNLSEAIIAILEANQGLAKAAMLLHPSRFEDMAPPAVSDLSAIRRSIKIQEKCNIANVLRAAEHALKFEPAALLTEFQSIPLYTHITWLYHGGSHHDVEAAKSFEQQFAEWFKTYQIEQVV